MCSRHRGLPAADSASGHGGPSCPPPGLAHTTELPGARAEGVPPTTRDPEDDVDTVRSEMLAQLARHRDATRIAPSWLLKDRKFVLAATVQQACRGGLLHLVAPALRKDHEIVLEAVKQDGNLLEFAAEELRADRRIVKEAVHQFGPAIQFAAVELQLDPRIAALANPNNRHDCIGLPPRSHRPP